MTSPDIQRDRAMEERVGRTLEDAGLTPGDVARVRAAHRIAMDRRQGRLDAHHPDFLHPGRTVLILALDTPLRDGTALAAAALLESERPELRPDPERVRAELGESVVDFLAEVPMGGDDLIEALLSASQPVRLVALAERLDHCRHAKFWSDRAEQERIHEQAGSVFSPLAERTDATLARRFAHWENAFARTLARG